MLRTQGKPPKRAFQKQSCPGFQGDFVTRSRFLIRVKCNLSDFGDWFCLMNHILQILTFPVQIQWNALLRVHSPGSEAEPYLRVTKWHFSAKSGNPRLEMFTLFLWGNFAATLHKVSAAPRWTLRKRVAVVVSFMSGADPPGPVRTGKKQARVCLHNIPN